MNQISKIPSGAWSIDFEKAIKTGKMNCSCASAFLGLVLESIKKITKIKKIEFGFPPDHGVNIVTLKDGRIFLLDPRKGIVEELNEKNSEIKWYHNLKVYHLKKDKRKAYQAIPVLPLKEGILVSYLGNLAGAWLCVQKKIPKGWSVSNKNQLKKLRKEFKAAEEKLQQQGKKLFEDKELSEKRILFLTKIRKIFGGNLLENYKGKN